MVLPMLGQPGPAAQAAGPTANPGEAAAAAAKVRVHLQGLEVCLGGLPIGSEMHDAVVAAIGKLSKAFPPGDEMPGMEQTALMGLAREAQQSAMMRQLMRSQEAGGGGGPPMMAPEGAM